MNRKLVVITVPVQLLTDVIAGRATISMPAEIPEDAEFIYSYVDPDLQVLKIYLSHESFKVEYTATYRAVIEYKPVPPPKPEPDKSLIDNNENFTRCI